jgi:hypothetical protein
VTANIRELAELYLETLSIDERDTLLSREILTTVVEVNASTTHCCPKQSPELGFPQPN